MPELALVADPLRGWSDRERAAILRALANLTEVFAEIAVIADLGEKKFYGPGHLARNAAVGALIRLLEQARGLPKDFAAQQQPVLDYSAMVRMRNILAHGFEDVEWPTVWSTVRGSRECYAGAHDAIRRQHDVRYATEQRWLVALRQQFSGASTKTSLRGSTYWLAGVGNWQRTERIVCGYGR